MARLKLKQVLSNLHYNASTDQLILSGSKVFVGDQNWEDANINWEDATANWEESVTQRPDFIIYGETLVTSSIYNTGSITITGIDNFGDSGSFYTMDLGDY